MLKLNNWPVLSVLTMVAAATTALSLFIKVAEEVVEGDTGKIDLLLIMALRADGNPTDPLGPRWVEDFARDITALGSPAVLGLFVLITAVFLLLAGKRRLSVFMLVATGLGTIAVTVLKEAFGRPRPQLMPDGVFIYTESFPSGHAMVSAVVYLTLGALIARLAPTTLLKLYIMMVAVILTGMVGFSRIYLGAHWPSDVLAGWAIGAAWALGGGAWAQVRHLDKESTK
ncbi:MAG: phosphatase PAP2 family protein [Methylococcaceae bacterium]|nr:phosphatase PAP2 family protein [Methylococcaceae bacterium]